MMNERIKQLAEQAGWMMGDEVEGFNTRLEKFAALVAAAEREACAKVCEEMEETNLQLRYEYRRAVLNCADAIRARGK